jgi:hypothetical protein
MTLMVMTPAFAAAVLSFLSFVPLQNSFEHY